MDTIKSLNENYLRKEEIEKERKALAEDCLGKDVWSNFYIDDKFNLYDNHLKPRAFKGMTSQELPLPFENATIEKMINIPKKALNFTFPIKKNVKGLFVIGNDNGKPVLYALTVVKYSNTDFSIKLDVCVKGMTLFNLLRLDCHPFNDHKNLIINGVPVQSKNQITSATNLHLHKNTKECQVLCNDLKYTTATPIELNKEITSSSEDDLFKKALKFFMKEINMSTELNLKNDSNWIFDDDKMAKANFCTDLEEFNK